MKLFTTTLFFIVLSTFTTQAANRYWVSNVAGVWNNTANWSATAGGAGGASVPSTIDHVYLSNVSGSGNITLDIDVSINGFITTTFTGTLDFNGHQFNPSFSNNAYVNIDHITISNSSGNVNLTYNTVAPTRFSYATINVPISVTSQRLQLINSTFNQNVTIYQTSVTTMSSSGGCTFNSTFRFYHYGNYDYKLGTSAKMTYNGRAFFYNYSSRKILISYSGQGSDFNHNLYVSNSNATLGSGIYFGALNAPSKLASGRRIYIGFAGFSNGQLSLRNFTQLGTTSQTLSFTGTASLYMKSTTWFGSVNFTAHRQFLISNNFRNVSSFNQTGSQTAISSGGNNFWGNCALTNSGTGNFRLGTSNPDIFHANLALNQTGSGVLVVAEKSIGNSVAGNLTISHQGTDVSNITLASDSLSSLNITGNTTITDLSTGTDNQTILGLNGDVTLTGDLTITNNSNSTASRVILGDDVKSSVSIDGISTITNTGQGTQSQIILGEKGDLTFNNTLNLINNSTATDSKIILNNQIKSSNLYRNIVFTCTNAASDGFFFGLNYGRGVIKNTYTLSSSNTGFTHGLLHFRNFVQQGTTTQNLTLTQNASLLLDRSYWYGSLNFKSPSISIKQNRFYNATASLEQTGANNTFSFGDNYAYKYLTIKNSGTGSFILGQTVRDQFTKGLRLWNTGAGKIYLGYSSTGNSVSQTLDIDNVGTTNNSNIYVGYSSSSQVSMSRATVNNSKGNTYFGYGGDITMAVLEINNNTTTDATTYVAYEQTSSVSISSPSYINNSGSGSKSNIIFGHQGDVTINGTLNINNSATAIFSSITLGNSINSFMAYNSDIVITSAGRSDSKILFGGNGATGRLATTKTITTPTFTKGELILYYFTQLGTQSQTLQMGSGGHLRLGHSTWNGNVNFKAGLITLNKNVFKLSSVFEATKSPSHCSGGNTFFGSTTVKASGGSLFDFGIYYPDLFKSNLTLEASKGTIRIAQSSIGNQVLGNIIATTSNYHAHIEFATTSNSSLMVNGTVTLRNYSSSLFSYPATQYSIISLGRYGDITLNNSLTIINSGGNCKNIINVAKELDSKVSIAGNTTITNSGAYLLKEVYLGKQGDVTLNGSLSIANSSTSTNSGVYLNHSSSSSNTYNQDIILKSTNANCDGIFFGKDGGSGTLANGKTVTIPSPSSTNFIGGTLLFKNFTQVGATPQSLTLEGTASFFKTESSTWAGNLNFKAPQIELKQSTFSGTSVIEKTGANNNLCYGGNNFARNSIIRTRGTGTLSMGNTSPDVFIRNLTLEAFNGEIVLAANTSNNIVNGQLQATSNGGDITISESSTSSIEIIWSTFLDNLSTSGDAQITLGKGGDITLKYLTINNSGGNSQNTISLARLENSTVTINRPAIINNIGGYTTRQIYLGYEGDIIWNSTLNLNNESFATNSEIYLNYQATSNSSYNQNISIKSTKTNCDGVLFGKNGGTGILASTKTISIPPPTTSNFIGGTLLLKNFTQLGNQSQSIQLKGSLSFLKLESSTWQGNITFEAPQIELKQSSFSGRATITKSKDTDNYCYGGNSFSDFAHFGNTSNGIFALGDIAPDTYQDVGLSNYYSGNLILANNSTSNHILGNLYVSNYATSTNSQIILANTASSSLIVDGSLSIKNELASAANNIYCGYSGDIEIQVSSIYENKSAITNSFIHIAYNPESTVTSNGNVMLFSRQITSSGITFGLNGGVSSIQALFHINGPYYGILHLENVNQTSTTPVKLELSNHLNSSILLKNTQWNANSVSIKSPHIITSNSTFLQNIYFTKLSAGTTNTSIGGNTFHGITRYYNYSSSPYVTASSIGNDYNHNVFYYQHSTGIFQPDYDQVSTYAQNITVYCPSSLHFGEGTNGGIKFDGTTAQFFENTYNLNPTISFGNLITQNSTSNIILNSSIDITRTLELNQGNIITSPTAVLTITDNATVTAVSNDAYIDGPVAKLGNDAFTFPVGNNGIYAPISISAPANTTDKFTASYHNSSPTTDGFNTASASNGVDYMSNTEYWKLDRTAGTDDVEVTLSWDDTRSGQIGAGTICESRVVQWDGSKWTNQGNGNATGNAASGTVTTGISRDCATTTPLTTWTNGYPLALASDSNYITWDGTVFEGGSGTSGAPGASDNSRNLKIFGANATLTENAHVKNVVITGTGSITIPDGMVAIVDGDIRNNGQITVENGGSLIQTKLGASNNTGTGNYTVKVTGNNSPSTYNIWSSPVQSAAITSVFTAANPCDIYAFDAPTQSWKYDYVANSTITCAGNTFAIDPSYVFSGADGNMDIARGYFAPGNAVNTRNFDGKINNGDISYAVTTTTLGNNPRWDNDDWNLLGNPYPSAITMASFWAQNASLISGALYFWDEGDAGSGYHQYNDYAYWNITGGLNSGNSSRIPNGNIAPGQGFWFYASNSGNAIFRNNMRTENAGVFFKSEPTENHNAWFSFKTPSGLENNILVGYNTDATDGYDSKYDANKTVGNTSVRMASIMNNDEYAIQSFAPLMIGSEKVIPLVVFTDSTGSHTFEMYRTENIPSNFKIYLQDLLLGLTTDLTQTDYSVFLNGNQEYLNRFELVFVNDITDSGNGSGTKGGNGGSDSTVTGIADFDNSNFVLTQTEGELIISNKNEFSGDLFIYDILGKTIFQMNDIATTGSFSISTKQFSSGTYILNLVNGKVNTYQRKFFKK